CFAPQPVWLSTVQFFFASRRRHTRCLSDWSSDVCSSDLISPSGLAWERAAPGEPAIRAPVSSATSASATTRLPFMAPPLREGRHDLARERLHRAQHARVLEVAEPERAVEVRDPDGLLDPLDLPHAGVGRADDEVAVEQLVDAGLLRRRHRDGAAVLDALVV